ncbi:AraC family transcriptional regulator [Alteriqipengyuania lutimaris]|uniref:AraC family transcriptional regulator n=1 Tax=Alteriqipengyuania lutimaris TaxID=1538146 RepID=UPI0015F1AFB7|nr:AraC family transcriptional regulator [Alteriqipengyuania lutimaris]MBB3033144.1 AraC-like DNA-binding protein [Alteriqipengyuania lutimaris]
MHYHHSFSEAAGDADTTLSRLFPFRAFIPVAESLDLDPYAILREAQISPDLLGKPDAWVSSESILRLLRETEVQSGCDNLGLKLFEDWSLADIGPLSLLLVHQENPRGIIDALRTHQNHASGMHQIGFEKDGQVATLRVGGRIGTDVRSAYESMVFAIYRMFKEIMRGSWQAETIYFLHSAPEDRSLHRRLFDCEVVFDAEFDGITMDAKYLDVPNPSAVPMLARYAEQLMTTVAPEISAISTAEKVRAAIHMHLSNANADVTTNGIARAIGMQSRQMQRVLREEGTTFGDILVDVRKELAIRYLTSSRHPIGQIASLLGYSNQSSFTRWFLSEFQQTPVSLRKGEKFKRAMQLQMF